MKPIRIAAYRLLLFTIVCCGMQVRCLGQEMVALPETSNVIGVLEEGESYLEFGFIGWGPNWQYLGFRGEVTEEGKTSRMNDSKFTLTSASWTSSSTSAGIGTPRLRSSSTAPASIHNVSYRTLIWDMAVSRPCQLGER